ncbi:MAG: LamG domain-containing protein [Leptolyngbya sp. BL-A-14]
MPMPLFIKPAGFGGSATDILKTGLLAWYDFENYNDSSPNGYHLPTDNAGGSGNIVENGKPGHCWDGRSFNYFNISTSSALYTATAFTISQSFTFACWINVQAWQVPSAGGTAIINRSNTNFGRHCGLNYYNGSLAFYVGDQTGAGVTLAGLTDPPTNTWLCCIGWFDAEAKTVNLEVNGTLVQSSAFSGTGLYAASNVLVIGNDVNFSDNQRLNGYLDTLAIWTRTLSSTERAAFYNGGNGRSY